MDRSCCVHSCQVKKPVARSSFNALLGPGGRCQSHAMTCRQNCSRDFLKLRRIGFSLVPTAHFMALQCGGQANRTRGSHLPQWRRRRPRASRAQVVHGKSALASQLGSQTFSRCHRSFVEEGSRSSQMSISTGRCSEPASGPMACMFGFNALHPSCFRAGHASRIRVLAREGRRVQMGLSWDKAAEFPSSHASARLPAAKSP